MADNAYPGWEADVESRIGAPQTPAVTKFLDQWHLFEESSAANNPLNTTLTVPGSTSINSAGVKSYGTPAIGGQATATTLLQAGYYPGIVAALRSGDPENYILSGSHAPYTTTEIISEFDKWGSISFANTIKGGAGGVSAVGPDVKSVTGAVGGAAKSVTGAVTGPINSVEDALKFVFSYRFLEIIGGAALVLVGLIGLMKEVGVSVPAPGPVGKAAAAVG